MPLSSPILLLLKISILLMVFGIGLSASREDIAYLLRRPGQLLRSFVSMNVVMPVLAATIALTFDLRPPVRIALVALSISPVPPLLPKRQAQAGAQGGCAVSLLFTMALLAIVYMPVAIAVLDVFSPANPYMPFPEVLSLVLLTVLVPLSAGVFVRGVAARFAVRAAKPVSLLAVLLLAVGLLLVFAESMPAIVSLIDNGTIAVFVAFVIVGLVVGHFLGGPVAEDRPVLALATACRHPAIAATIAITNFPEQKLVLPAILLYLLVNVVFCLPYMVWRKRQGASRAAASPS